MKKINLVVFGATGSIGKSVFSVVRNNKDHFNVEGITCDKNINQLLKIAKEFNVTKLGFNSFRYEKNNRHKLNDYKVFIGNKNFDKIITRKTDIIIFAISGLSAIDLALRIIELGKIIGLANKECIISLGKKLIVKANKSHSKIVPLDSEHNAVHHLLKLKLGKFKSITLTASGGPFRNLPLRQFKEITVKQAIKHPIWKMGKKISIDSATMMNKALEIIEAKYLFDLKHSEINAIIHPQAQIHALINYENGASTALLNNPDMRIPIASLFFGFNNSSNNIKNLKLTDIRKLEFYEIDKKKFPAIDLCYDVLNMGGLAPHIFNYLNECLVNKFISNQIKFNDIVALNSINLERFFNKNRNLSNPSTNDIYDTNNWINKNIYLGKK